MVASGVYRVKESGLVFEHRPGEEEPVPKDGKDFVQRFRNRFEMNVLENDGEQLVVELIGVDASFVNALRRILLSELPTMALEHVYMWNNSGIVQDEVLAHRLGLVPLKVDPRRFDELQDGDDPTDRNTLVFRMVVSCTHQEAADHQRTKQEADDNPSSKEPQEESSPEEQAALEAAAKAVFGKVPLETPGRPFTKHVYSRDLVWVPQGEQEDRFPEGICPIHDDILLAKLRPGQAIELEAHAQLGNGRNHAKFSPVATASYRLMPHIQIIEPVYDKLAEQLVHLYEPGVFELVPVTPGEDPPGTTVKARVSNPHACTMSRNFMRDPQLAKSIRMTRIPNHYLFSVESIGSLHPGVLLAEALRVLQGKCQSVTELVDKAIAKAKKEEEEKEKERMRGMQTVPAV